MWRIDSIKVLWKELRLGQRGKPTPPVRGPEHDESLDFCFSGFMSFSEDAGCLTCPGLKR